MSAGSPALPGAGPPPHCDPLVLCQGPHAPCGGVVCCFALFSCSEPWDLLPTYIHCAMTLLLHFLSFAYLDISVHVWCCNIFSVIGTPTSDSYICRVSHR